MINQSNTVSQNNATIFRSGFLHSHQKYLLFCTAETSTEHIDSAFAQDLQINAALPKMPPSHAASRGSIPLAPDYWMWRMTRVTHPCKIMFRWAFSISSFFMIERKTFVVKINLHIWNLLFRNSSPGKINVVLLPLIRRSVTRDIHLLNFCCR